MLYIQAPVRRSHTHIIPSFEAEPAVEGDSLSIKMQVIGPECPCNV